MGRGDLTDAQWAMLEPLLPGAAGRGRPAIWSKRRLIDGIRWRVRTGAPWRDVPACYGPWQTVYGLFRRWQREGLLLCDLVGNMPELSRIVLADGDEPNGYSACWQVTLPEPRAFATRLHQSGVPNSVGTFGPWAASAHPACQEMNPTACPAAEEAVDHLLAVPLLSADTEQDTTHDPSGSRRGPPGGAGTSREPAGWTLLLTTRAAPGSAADRAGHRERPGDQVTIDAPGRAGVTQV
ncbi:hypothetical protein GCM10010176_029340 [Nonomuraea spiralis]|nr:hypothetical protein GCM10010176_029340 [Nonomuraea spiralis]